MIYVAIMYAVTATSKISISTHCKDLHLQYISTTSLEMGSTSLSGVRLPDVLHYIFSTSPLHLSVVIIGTT